LRVIDRRGVVEQARAVTLEGDGIAVRYSGDLGCGEQDRS